MRKTSLVFLSCLLLTACANNNARVQKQLQEMSLEQKIGQMFIVRPEALDTAFFYDSATELKQHALQEVTPRMRAVAQRYPMGGIILFGHNIKDPEQLERFMADLKSLPGNPLLSVDEEGGRVARLANNPAFHLTKLPPMATLAAAGRTKEVYDAAYSVGTYLKQYGFDIDFAPVADVNTNPMNIVIGDRAFSNSPQQAAPMVKNYVKGLQKAGVISCIKHFPGHGDTQADSHFGYAMSRKSWAEIIDCEMIPFRAGINAGAQMIMTAHISLPNVIGSNLPSTLSPMILQEKLRGELSFRGVIITDAMEMGAILRQYPIQDACIMAVKAGVDMLLCVREYPQVFDALVAAVRRGEIPESRIDESVLRILRLRQAAGK